MPKKQDGRKNPEYTLTIKQEAFARFYIETQDDGLAYDRAYLPVSSDPKSYNKKGRAVRENPKVAKRIRELQDEAAIRAGITATRIINKTWAILEKAEAKGQFMAALKGLDQLSRIMSLYKDSIEITGKLSIDQVAQQIHRRAIDEGITEGEFLELDNERSDASETHEESHEAGLLPEELSGSEKGLPKTDRDDASNTRERKDSGLRV